MADKSEIESPSHSPLSGPHTSQIEKGVTHFTGAEVACRAYFDHQMRHAKSKEGTMLNALTFAIAAVALGMPFLVPLMWGRTEKDR